MPSPAAHASELTPTTTGPRRAGVAESRALLPLAAVAPALAISGALAFLMGAILVLQVICQSDLYFVRKQETLGLDMKDFFVAGGLWAAGNSPYEWWRYVTPPLPAFLSRFLVPLGWPHFLAVALAVSIASCGAAYALAVGAFYRLRSAAGAAILLLGVSAMAISYPFVFLVDRGNVDGIVFALMCAAIVLAGTSRDVCSGVLVATAASVKLYPAVLVIPMLLHRKWRLLAVTLMALVALALLTGVGACTQYLSSRLLARGTFFRVNENGSLVNFCHFVRLLFGAQQTPAAAGYALFAALLGATVLVDAIALRRGARGWAFTAVSYFPFMVAVPMTVYHYSFLILLALIPSLCAAAESATNRWVRGAIALACAGVVLTQSQAVALEKLLRSLQFSNDLALGAYFFPALGLFLAMVGLLGIKFGRIHEAS
jgi:hypothetical protein